MTLLTRARRSSAWLAAVIGLAAPISVAVFMQTRLDQELSDLPHAERRALFERPLETLRTACIQARGPEVSDYCCEQANFIKHFPECDGTCRELAAHFALRGR